MNLTRLAACAFLSTLLLSSPLLAGVGEILSLERQIRTRAEAVNLPSGNRVDVEENDRAPDPGPWVSAVVSNARAQENESVSFVSTAYQRSSAILIEGGGREPTGSSYGPIAAAVVASWSAWGSDAPRSMFT